jgi:ferredoxin-NADP reductase
MPSVTQHPIAGIMRGVLRAQWLHRLNEAVAAGGRRSAPHPTFPARQVSAQLAGVILEARNVRTFVLRPERRWPGFRPGQHVVVEVEIDGVRHHRAYSLSGVPGDRRIMLTVKRQPDGKVSNWLHRCLRIGDRLKLNGPAGKFALPAMHTGKLLMLSAGSGITPLMSMLRDLHAQRGRGDSGEEIAFVHSCREPAEAIFGAELRNMAAAWPSLHLTMHYTRDRGRLDVAALRQLVANFAEYRTLACGPPGFMHMVMDHWRACGLQDRLQVESFGRLEPRGAPAVAGANAVRCIRSEKMFAAAGGPLLAEAERAGLSPRYGCRIGICRSCQCRKLSGTVQNLLSGALSSAPDETIQLCISVARSGLSLDL